MDRGFQQGPALKRLVVSGLAWKGISQVVTQGTRLLVAVALARILAPHDYGLAGMVLVFTSFVLVVSDLALGSRLVQKFVLNDVDYSTAFWTSVGAGALFSALGIALAGTIAGIFGHPVLEPMIAVLSLSFFFSGISLTQTALLVKSMSFRALELREMLATVLGGAIGIAVALMGYGAWAIIAQQLSSSVLATLLVWRYSSWRPKLTYSLASLRDFAGFSSNMLGVNLLAQLRATSDNFIVGRFVGASALGLYAIAYNLILVPFNRIAIPLSQVLFPAMSQLQHDRERMRGYWIRSLRLIAAIAMPSLLGLIVLAPDFVHVVLGDRWAQAVPVVRLLAVVGLMQTLQFLNGTILQTLDRTGRLLKWSIFSYSAALASFIVGLHWGVVGIAAAYACTSVIVEPLFGLLTARTIGLPFRKLVHAVARVAEGSAVMALLLLGARAVFIHVEVPTTVRLLALVVIGGAFYAAFCVLRAPEVVAEVRGIRPRRPVEIRPEGKVAPATASSAGVAAPGS